MRELNLRVARLEAHTVYTKSFVAATFTTDGAGGQPPTSTQWVGRLHDVLLVQIGNREHVLLDVQWYRHMENDTQLPGLRRVRVEGAGNLLERQLIEAKRLDEQVSVGMRLSAAAGRWRGAAAIERCCAGAELELDHCTRRAAPLTQVWMTSIPGQPGWRHVHVKLKAAHVLPEHLLPQNLE